jgi:hypothetical protein
LALSIDAAGEETAVDDEHLAVDEAGGVRGEERRGSGEFLDVAEAPERGAELEPRRRRGANARDAMPTGGRVEVTAAGDVAILSGTAGFEDWVTGQVVADVSSITTDKATIMTGDVASGGHDLEDPTPRGRTKQ